MAEKFIRSDLGGCVDINKEIFWYEIDQIFQQRFVKLLTIHLTEIELRNRIEEILYLRDQMKILWESKCGQ